MKKLYLITVLAMCPSILSLAMEGPSTEPEVGKISSRVLSVEDRETLERAHELLPKVTSSSSESVQSSADGTVWLHVSVTRSPVKALAEAWTTTGRDKNSPHVNVGSIRLYLGWASKQESTVTNNAHHHIYEWSSAGAFDRAYARAWTTGPDIGPVLAETSM